MASTTEKAAAAVQEQLVDDVSVLGMEVLRRIDGLAAEVAEHGIAETPAELARVHQMGMQFADHITGMIEEFAHHTVDGIQSQDRADFSEALIDYAYRLQAVEQYIRGFVEGGGVVWALVRDLEDGPWDRASITRSLRRRLLFIHERLENAVLEWVREAAQRARPGAPPKMSSNPLDNADTLIEEPSDEFPRDFTPPQSGLESDYSFADEGDSDVLLPPVMAPSGPSGIEPPPVIDDFDDLDDLPSLANIAPPTPSRSEPPPLSEDEEALAALGEDDVLEAFSEDDEDVLEAFGADEGALEAIGDEDVLEAFGEDDEEVLEAFGEDDEPIETLDDDALISLEDDAFEILDDVLEATAAADEFTALASLDEKDSEVLRAFEDPTATGEHVGATLDDGLDSIDTLNLDDLEEVVDDEGILEISDDELDDIPTGSIEALDIPDDSDAPAELVPEPPMELPDPMASGRFETLSSEPDEDEHATEFELPDSDLDDAELATEPLPVMPEPVPEALDGGFDALAADALGGEEDTLDGFETDETAEADPGDPRPMGDQGPAPEPGPASDAETVPMVPLASQGHDTIGDALAEAETVEDVDSEPEAVTEEPDPVAVSTFDDLPILGELPHPDDIPPMPTLQERFDTVIGLAREWEIGINNLPEELEEDWITVLEERVGQLVERRRERQAEDQERQERLTELMALADSLRVRVTRVPERPSQKWLEKMAAKLDEVKAKRVGDGFASGEPDLPTGATGRGDPSDVAARVATLVDRAQRVGAPLGAIPEIPTQAWLQRTEARMETFLAQRRADRKTEREAKKRARKQRLDWVKRHSASYGIDVGRIPPFPTDEWLERAEVRIASTLRSQGRDVPPPEDSSLPPSAGRAVPTIVFAEGTVQEERWPVLGDLVIGRAPDCDVQIVFDQGVSRTHCRIRLLPDGRYEVEDAGSTKGTRVDGERIDGPTVLPLGSVLRVGETELLFVERGRTP